MTITQDPAWDEGKTFRKPNVDDEYESKILLAGDDEGDGHAIDFDTSEPAKLTIAYNSGTKKEPGEIVLEIELSGLKLVLEDEGEEVMDHAVMLISSRRPEKSILSLAVH